MSRKLVNFCTPAKPTASPNAKIYPFPLLAPVAQLVEQLPFKELVPRSSRGGGTATEPSQRGAADVSAFDDFGMDFDGNATGAQ